MNNPILLSCHAKRAFNNAPAARRAVRKANKKTRNVSFYHCPACGKYHLTHQK